MKVNLEVPMFQEPNSNKRGEFYIFLGARPGAGKTYTMLEAARNLLAKGVDVVAANIVTYGRPETEALKQGIPEISLRRIEYERRSYLVMDLEELLQRHPQLAVIDELQTLNCPLSRNPFRYQDIRDLLYAGINVFTTVNVQFFQSLNDILAYMNLMDGSAKIPDQILNEADRVFLIDSRPAYLKKILDMFFQGNIRTF